MMVLLMMSGMAQAALTTIGTATYDDGSGAKDYKLIWDDDYNGQSLVWLDYTNDWDTWQHQRSWASGLDTVLDIHLNAGYTVTWDNDSWRLPSGGDTEGYNSYSEMGHLYYEELGNHQSNYGLNNTGDFEHLKARVYWSGMLSDYEDDENFTVCAWAFNMDQGSWFPINIRYDVYGLAVRSGEVSVSPVPVPGAIILLGSGLFGVAGIGRKIRRDV